MYEISFLKLSDRYYKAAPWPEVHHIAEVVDQDHVFCLLYKVTTSCLFCKCNRPWRVDQVASEPQANPHKLTSSVLCWFHPTGDVLPPPVRPLPAYPA